MATVMWEWWPYYFTVFCPFCRDLHFCWSSSRYHYINGKCPGIPKDVQLTLYSVFNYISFIIVLSGHSIAGSRSLNLQNWWFKSKYDKSWFLFCCILCGHYLALSFSQPNCNLLVWRLEFCFNHMWHCS